MNTKQIQYALALAEELSFSQVAEKLGISQPALSKQIQHLEKELGVKLFERNTQPITVTPAGEHFLTEAKELVYREDQLLRAMEAFHTGERGRLVIGISPFRSLYLIPEVVKAVREAHPGVQVVLHEAGSDILRKETAEGKYDFAIVNLPVDESVLDVMPLEADSLVLAVPNEMANALPSESGERLPQISLKDCSKLPFVTVGNSQEMRQLLVKCCAAANFRPIIATEVVGLSTAWAMCRAGIGATLLPLQFIEHMGLDENISLFSLKDSIHLRQPVIITRRGQYISQYAKCAIKLLVK